MELAHQISFLQAKQIVWFFMAHPVHVYGGSGEGLERLVDNFVWALEGQRTIARLKENVP